MRKANCFIDDTRAMLKREAKENGLYTEFLIDLLEYLTRQTNKEKE